MTEEAFEQFAEGRIAPLSIEHHLTLALEPAQRLGEKPVTAEIVEASRSLDIHALQPKRIRHGCNAEALTELLNVCPSEFRALRHGAFA